MKKFLNYILFGTIVIFLGSNFVFAASKQCVYCDPDALGIPLGIPKFISSLINIVKILVPIILIVMGMFQYVKVVMSGEDKTIKETNQSFIRSILSAVFIFLITAVVQSVFNMLGTTGKPSLACVSCFISGDCSNITKSCPVRETGMCIDLTQDKCNENSNICEWKDNKCVDIGTSSSEIELHYCYECYDDASIRYWGTELKVDSVACPSGYYTTGDTTKNSCLNYACYQYIGVSLSDDGNKKKYVWSLGTPNYTENSSGAGWYKLSDVTTKDQCERMDPEYQDKCYQCDADSSKIVWGSSTNANDLCSNLNGAYHELTRTEEECK